MVSLAAVLDRGFSFLLATPTSLSSLLSSSRRISLGVVFGSDERASRGQGFEEVEEPEEPESEEDKGGRGKGNNNRSLGLQAQNSQTATPIPVVVIVRDATAASSSATGKKLNLKELRLASEDLLKEFFELDKDSQLSWLLILDSLPAALNQKTLPKVVTVADVSIAASSSTFALHALSSSSTVFLTGSEIVKYSQNLETDVKVQELDFASRAVESPPGTAVATSRASSKEEEDARILGATEIKNLDVQNSYFPIGSSDLEEPIAIRPTSETAMCPYYAKWIKSHPSSVGNSRALDRSSVQENSPGKKATPFVSRKKKPTLKSVRSWNFSRPEMFNIVVEDPNDPTGQGKLTIGVMVMVHGDNQELVLPPRVVNVQVVVVSCGITVKMTDEQRAEINKACGDLAATLKEGGVKAKADLRDGYTPGYKFNDWEQKGVPVVVIVVVE
ncbi:hypothetical protein PQX77_010104 [Marasmius sp. AFHP31]|nr:hypothetical protein PQX77_010104 [Marasmius sp. AFHP31]